MVYNMKHILHEKLSRRWDRKTGIISYKPLKIEFYNR